ncbi:glycosyltransferase [Thalassospira sp. HF15]|uniref:glycosyltransferase n=1 Tax=Thalassospira sp. HF15 TaxID=2722755 RepID=UPI00142F69AF|nr:glycosyltransferase [Thalassospira sp. HF15]NIY75460.1 glycosyltransferase [Thalassospira sp. HF15]
MANATKISIVIRSLERGGTETHLLRTLPAIAEAGFDIEVFCFERPGELAEKMREENIKVVTPPISGWPKHIPLVFKPVTTVWTCLFFLYYLFSRNPRIVHFFLPAAYLLLGPISLLHSSKKVMSRRSLNRYLTKYPKWVRQTEQFLHGKMSLILANSKAVVEELKQTEFVSSRQLSLIYNGVPEFTKTTSPDLKSVREELGIRKETIVFLFVANLLPYKGGLDLIKACCLLGATNSLNCDWCLIIIGDNRAGKQGEMEQLAEKYSIRSRLHFVGKQPNIDRYLAASDVGVLVSHEEGFSNFVLEGMSAGIPMIVSDVGGNPEAVVNGVTGMVVPSRNPEKLAEAMSYLIENREVADTMGRAGRVRAKEEFSILQSARGYCQVYHSLEM